MITALTALGNRIFGVLGRVSMYRLVLASLGTLVAIAFVLSLFAVLVPTPVELLVSLVVLSLVCAATDAAAQRILKLPWRVESSLITAAILLFVLRPTLEPLALVGIAVAAAVASASKYVLAWRGRHIFNPAAVGATVLTVASLWVPELGASAWWVGTPFLAGPVLLLGLVVLVRTEKVRVIVVFLLVAIAVGFLRLNVQFAALDLAFDPWAGLWGLIVGGPFLFLGAFMLSEPLTLPPRRHQQLTVAVIVGVLAGWPIPIGEITLGQERALLIGNLIAFFFAFRSAVRLTLIERRTLTPTVRELRFRTSSGFSFKPGQYLELEVPHAHPDARGTRREFSIVSSPEELPEVAIALRESPGAQSSFKKALAEVNPGDRLGVTGVWGDFLLPTRTGAPVLLVAAGIGVTPFVSQLRHVRLAEEDRDVVFVYVVSQSSELAFRDELEASGVPVLVFARDEPEGLPRHWRWMQGERLSASSLAAAVPDLAGRHAYVSGPPALIADLAPALEKARSLTTDAFAGY